MQFHSSITDTESSHDAVDEAIEDAVQATGGKIDAVYAFFTSHHRDSAEDILERLWLELDPQALIGCSAEGVIGGDREIERQPGIAVLAAQLPDVRLHPFHLSGRTEWHDVLSDPAELTDRLGLGPQTRALIMFGDPFTTPTDQLLAAIDQAAPGVPVVGGMASGAQRPGNNVLLRNDQTFSDGIVGMALGGPLRVQTVVSQGCRPIGSPLVITRSRENVIEQLGGKPAMQALQEVVESVSDRERQLLEDGLLIGRAISEYRERFGRGDFLVRNLIGADRQSGALAVADYVKTGQTVQFHVRDAQTADEDLSLMLEAPKAEGPPAGGLLFSCNGRGTRMFPEACHDIAAVRRAFPAAPFAGFFAAGELGPVGGRNFIHGHTASLALFRPQE